MLSCLPSLSIDAINYTKQASGAVVARGRRIFKPPPPARVYILKMTYWKISKKYLPTVHLALEHPKFKTVQMTRFDKNPK